MPGQTLETVFSLVLWAVLALCVIRALIGALQLILVAADTDGHPESAARRSGRTCMTSAALIVAVGVLQWTQLLAGVWTWLGPIDNLVLRVGAVAMTVLIPLAILVLVAGESGEKLGRAAYRYADRRQHRKGADRHPTPGSADR